MDAVRKRGVQDQFPLILIGVKYNKRIVALKPNLYDTKPKWLG